MRAAFPNARAGLLVVVLTTACAVVFPRDDRPYVEGPVLLVNVQNNALPDSAEVWLTPAAGPRRKIGSVAPSSERLLQTWGSDSAAEYRLSAELRLGNAVTSRPFTVRGDAIVSWDLAANTVTLLGPQSAAGIAGATPPRRPAP